MKISGIMEDWNNQSFHRSTIPLFQLSKLPVRFSASPRIRRSQNQMNDHREENEHYQIK